MIRDPSEIEPGTEKGERDYVPTLALSDYTRQQLENFKYADSITIDPHKSGYCPYPAGGLCYRDGRMRFLVTWTSPVVYRGDINTDVESIGVYGVEGSKPGAAAVGAYLSHRILGLHWDGYGTLLGEAILTCTRLYCHWVTMDPKPIQIGNVKAKLVVRTFTILPTERNGGTPEQIEAQKQFIRDNILGKDNATVFKNEEAVKLLKQLGGNIQINAFACNFEVDGQTNEDVIEANYLNSRIYNTLSVSTITKNLSDVPLYLTSTQFSQSAYKDCLDTYKRRLGVKGSQDLYKLINVTMSPWSTADDFVQTLANRFQATAEHEMQAAMQRNVQTPDHHGFIIQGIEGNRICGVHLPMFNMQNHRWQLIISCSLPEKELNEVRERKKKAPSMFFTFGNKTPEELPNLISDGASFEAELQEGFPWDNKPISKSVQVTEIKVVYIRSTQSRFLAPSYPDHMTFYTYSAQRGSDHKPIFNIDHLLNVSPNIQLNSDTIAFKVDDQEEAEKTVKESGCWFTLTGVHESALQPLTQDNNQSKEEYDVPGLGFVPNAKFAFEARAAKGNEPPSPGASVIFKGTLTLGSAIFADVQMVNADGGAEQDAPVPTALLGQPDTDTSGLVAEYPNQESMLLELRNTYQQSRMYDFAQQYKEARALQARRLVQKCEASDGKEAPKWARALSGTPVDGHVDGETNGQIDINGANPYATTTRMYHSHR